MNYIALTFGIAATVLFFGGIFYVFYSCAAEMDKCEDLLRQIDKDKEEA